jgi:hypothetical protein
MALRNGGLVAADPLHVPLTPRAPSTMRGFGDYVGVAEGMRNKYGVGSGNGNGRRAVGGFGLMNQACFWFLFVSSSSSSFTASCYL